MPDCFKLDGKGEYIRNNTEDSEPRRGVLTSKNIMSKEGKVSRSESEADIVQNHSMSKKKKEKEKTIESRQPRRQWAAQPLY